MSGAPHVSRCAGCHKKIRSRYLVQTLGKEWHESCLRCDVCQETLYSFGEKMYFKKGRMLCKEDYMRLYVPGGECSMCKQTIPPNEKVMKFKNNLNYHLPCFQCVFCQYRFNVGDRVFIPKPNIILCSRHWMSDSDSVDNYLEVESDVVKMIEIMS